MRFLLYRDKEKKESFAITKEDFYQLFIDRLLEIAPYGSEDLDKIANAFSTAQGRRIDGGGEIHKELMELSFFGHLERWSPDIVQTVKKAHEQSVETFERLYGKNNISNTLIQPGTQSEGQQLANILRDTIHKQLQNR